jgi:ATP-dependent DNA helicase RecG
MPIDITSLTESQLRELFDRGEGHFLDFKSKRLAPGRLTKTLSAFANADGGELYVGIEDGNTFDRSLWNGFTSAEEANGFVQTFEEFFPLGTYFRYQFLRLNDLRGLVLHSEIMKTPDIRPASDGIHYLRRGAQNLPQDTDEKLTRLRFNKGINSYEDFLINAPVEEVANSAAIIDFMLDNIPTAEPEPWMRKQQLISDTRPTVAAVLLYADEPQALLPKTGIKIYRYKTAGQGSRDTLTENPITIEGHAYKVIFEAVRELIEIVEGISIMGPEGLEKASYPKESIHEILTNAVLHRDYSLNDEIHLRVFDNRIEVQSPGTLPAHVTVKNILDERFSRNPRIVRLINKYRNPPNKDVGEGLNTELDPKNWTGS